MINKAIFWAIVPFGYPAIPEKKKRYCENATKKCWNPLLLGGDWLFKNVNYSLQHNVYGFKRKVEENIYGCYGANTIAKKNKTQKNMILFSIDEVGVYCFDSGTGFVSLKMIFDSKYSKKDLLSLCSLLRCSDGKSEKTNIYRNKTSSTNIIDVAGVFAKEIFEEDVVLYQHLSDGAMHRVDILSAVLCDWKDDEQDELIGHEKFCFMLANAYDDRNLDIKFDNSDFIKPHNYIRWSISKRCMSVVANLTGEERTDNHLSGRWIESVEKNYLSTYILVLHQKYATYNLLYTLSKDIEKNYERINRKILIDFNSKYVFSVVSDEYFVQNVFRKLKKEQNVDELYGDLEDELQRLFEYSQVKKEEKSDQRNSKFTILSLIISVLCSVSIIFDTLEIFTSHGCSFGISCWKDRAFVFAIAVEIIFLVFCLLYIYRTTSGGKANK